MRSSAGQHDVRHWWNCRVILPLKGDPQGGRAGQRWEGLWPLCLHALRASFWELSWEKKTMGSQRQCYPRTQPGAAPTHIIIRGRFIVAQESNLEVCADKPPVDSTLTGIFLDTLQDCVGFTQQLLTWWKPKQCVLRVLRQAGQASPALFLHRQTQATAQQRGDNEEWGPWRSEIAMIQTQLRTGHFYLLTVNNGRVQTGGNDLGYTGRHRS